MMVLQKNDNETFSLQLGPWISGLVIALIMFMLAQSIIALRWGAQLDQRVEAIETVIQDSKVTHSNSNNTSNDLQIRLARLEERLSLIYDSVRRFEERLVPRRVSPEGPDRP